MKLVRSPLVLLMLAACSAPSALPEGDIYGEPMQAREVVRLSVVGKDPEARFDQPVLVEAKVVAVCTKAGCWMQVEDEGQMALVRWDRGYRGEYQFPADLVGQRVLIQGSLSPKSLMEGVIEPFEEEASGKLGSELEGYEMNASSVLRFD